MNVLPLLAPILAGVLSLVLVGVYAAFARRRGVIDHPGTRSSHETPTPTGAGIAMVLALVIAGGLVGFSPDLPRLGPLAYDAAWLGVIGGMLVLSLVGLWDDMSGLSPWLRLSVQLLVAIALVASLESTLLIAGMSAFLLVWTMNAYNFMDGSDGLAGAQAMMSGAVLSAVFWFSDQAGLALAALSLVAVGAGFLPWNLSRTKVFMGDAGSVALGFSLGALCLLGVHANVLPWPAALTVLAVFYMDAGLTLLWRLGRGERWYTAHRQHVYQRLIAQGWSHRQVLLLYMTLNAITVVPAVGLATVYPDWALAFAGLAMALLAMAWSAVSLKLGEGP